MTLKSRKEFADKFSGLNDFCLSEERQKLQFQIEELENKAFAPSTGYAEADELMEKAYQLREVQSLITAERNRRRRALRIVEA